VHQPGGDRIESPGRVAPILAPPLAMADENPALEVKSSGDDAWFEARVAIDSADPSRLVAKIPRPGRGL